MRYFVLLGFLTAGTYAAAAIVTAVLVSIVWPRCRRWLPAMAAHRRAQLLAALRAAPAAVGLGVAVALAGVFLRFEPRSTTESPSLILVLSAAAALIFAAVAMARGHHALVASWQCRRLLRNCDRSSIPDESLPLWIVDTPYPIAAVTGVLRPRLLVSARILRECPPEEMQAILRHEAAHVRRRDNLFRAFTLGAPDPLQFGSTGREIARAWAAAAEQAADDEAAGDREDMRANLASALVRVSRMGHGAPPAWASGVAFFEGSNLEERVHRLLAPGAAIRRGRTLSAAATLLVAAVTAVIAADSIAFRVHTLMEAAVNVLP